MRARLVVPILLLGVAVLTAFATCASASGTPDAIPDEVLLVTTRLAPDSARAIATWKPACDAKGCADAYLVQWTNAGKAVRSATVPGTADTVRLGLPPYGDSTRITFTVTTQRRGKLGPSRTASITLQNVDVAPPGVDSLKVDTSAVAYADSARLDVFTSRGGQFLAGDSAYAIEGDSVLIVQRVWLKPGVVRPTWDTTKWTVHNDGPTMVLRKPFGVLRDSVWLYAASCGCRESRDAANPPRLNPATGRYQVRSASGGWRPVTPLSVDPFRDVAAR